jgi:GntR family transcriptional repressor for pyruvate dehydrogenase complex
MKILDAFGIVSVRRGNGTYISESIENALIDPFLLTLMMSRRDITELIEFREMLEVQVVTMAVRKASKEDIAELGHIVTGMESLIGSESDKDKLVEADIRFHNALSRATRNTYVSRLYTYIMNFFQFYIAKTYENENNIQSACAFHSAIYQAVRDRDPARAVEATRQSIEDWAEKFKNFA